MQWLMLQHDKPEDCVIATAVQHSVRQSSSVLRTSGSHNGHRVLSLEQSVPLTVTDGIGEVIDQGAGHCMPIIDEPSSARPGYGVVRQFGRNESMRLHNRSQQTPRNA